MPFITKAARAAALEATGVTEKIDALRREVTAAIQRAEDHMREDVGALREDVRVLRAESSADRQAMFDLARGFSTDAANDRRDAANDRQAMADIAERIRKDSEADRRAMMALVETHRQGPA